MIRAALTLAMLAGPAAAQTFNLPQGCEGYVTIQKRECMVTHNFICATDPEGYQRRVDLTQTGMVYMSTIDAETQWVESFSPLSGETEVLGPVIEDAASFSDLLEVGADSWNFSTTSDRVGVTQFTGLDRLTGRTVVIDGVQLEETEFEMTVRNVNGQELWRSEGREFIHRDWRVFVSGTRQITTPDESYGRDSTPVEFSFPGEPGFLAAEPIYDCDVILSLAEPVDIPLPTLASAP
ncbi:hypothetical protein [Octadecabacter sp. R77987]|uniref:hypothetical protein n=1 Tax=Octadecabacter sp. R77987 TaxID=3093874 RepID=UPI00366E0E94